MVCTYCGQSTRVVNSRHQRSSNQVWRRRQCLTCQATFSTEEKVQHELAWLVDSKGSLQPFLRDKLFLSVYRSCEHRPSSLNDAHGLTQTIIRKLPAYLVGGALNARDITRVAQVALNRFDTAASTHYQAFHH